MFRALLRGTTNQRGRPRGALHRCRVVAILVVLILVGTALRLYQLGAGSLWEDEIATAVRSAQSIHQIWNAIAIPLTYIFSHLFLELGQSEFVLRLPHALVGILAIPLLYQLGKTMFGRQEGLTAALLLTLSPFHLYYSQEVRYYALMMTLSILSLYMLYRALDTASWGYWLAFAVVTAGNIHNHYFALLPLAAEIIFVFILIIMIKMPRLAGRLSIRQSASWAGRSKENNLSGLMKGYVGSLLIIGVLFLPKATRFVLFLQKKSGLVSEGTQEVIFRGSIADFIARISGFGDSYTAYYIILVAFILGLVACALEWRREFLWPWLWILMPFLLIYLMKSKRIVEPRYLSFTVPICILYAAKGLISGSQLISGWLWKRMAIKHIHPVTLGISLSLLVGTAIPGIATSYARSENKPYWRELGAFLLHNVAPGELVVHDITAWRAPYYSPGVRKAIVESSAGDLDAFYARNSVVWLTLRTRDKNLALREWVEAKPHWALDFGSGVYVAYVQQGSTTPELWRKLLTMSLGPKAAPYVSLGRQFAFLQNTQQAEAYFKTALLKEGSLVDAYTCLGQLYEAEGRVAEAIAEYEKATHAILKDPESYFHLGVAYRTLGKTEQAASCFRQALQLAGDYDYYKYYNALAETYLTMGQPEAAARLYEKALKRHSWLNQQWYFHLNLGKAYQKAGQRQKAWESFKKAWMLRPDSEETGKALEDLVTTGGTSFGSSIPDLRATINAQPSAIQYRVGVAVNASDAFPKITGEEIKKLGAGWYCDWHTDLRYPLPDLEYVPIIPVSLNHYPPSGPQLIYLEMLLNHRPGALWLIGSEPENAQGANLAPAEYAEIYHNYYQFIKERDPWAQVSTGGIAQPTLLRLRWLEEVIAAYQSHYNQPLPVDAWNIHILILREKKPYPDCPDCWGIGVPAGLEGVAQGQLYEIQDNADPNIFRQLVIEFRKWMKRNGFQDKPLIISQFGVLMPSDMLGESLEAGDMVVQTFLQETLDFLFTAQDEELGCPTDGGRLVQRWLWYSLNDRLPYVKETTGELRGANGSLVYWDTPDRLTPFGETFRAYMDKLLMSSP